MRYSIHCTSEPAVEPLTLQKARDDARVDADRTEEDWLIRRAIKAARQMAETETHRRFITQTWRIAYEGFYAPVIEIPLSPLQSIVSIKYFDSSNVEQTLDPSAYEYDQYAVIPRVRPVWNTQWPATRLRFDGVVITAIFGYGDTPNDVPEGIRHWISVQTAAMYDNRSIVSDSGELIRNKFLDGLLDSFRIIII